ncbi:MAG: RDD family protein [Pseudomonadota bacterium]
MEENAYSPPEAELLSDSENEASRLASRWARLGASIVDGVTIMIVTLPVMYLTGGFEGISENQQPSFLHSMGMAILSIVVFAIINTKSLIDRGQTLGKKLLNVRAVSAVNGETATREQLLRRYAVYLLPNQIPFLGGIFSLVNILFIFGSRKRCIHDIVGDTIVVRC